MTVRFGGGGGGIENSGGVLNNCVAGVGGNVFGNTPDDIFIVIFP